MLNEYFFDRHLDDEETVHMVVHKHWLIGVKALWLPTIVFCLVWSVLYVVRTKYAIYGVSLASIGIAIWWIRNFMDYYLDAWLITNKGVIDLEWHGWFHRSSSRILYSDINGVEYEIKGILGTLMGYGEMTLEKVSTGDAITMPYVKKPRRVETAILEAMEAYMLKKNLKDATTVQNILSEFVASSMQKQNAVSLAKKIPKKL